LGGQRGFALLLRKDWGVRGLIPEIQDSSLNKKTVTSHLAAVTVFSIREE
jgi:hypothetical protein